MEQKQMQMQMNAVMYCHPLRRKGSSVTLVCEADAQERQRMHGHPLRRKGSVQAAKQRQSKVIVRRST
jgi:hypothetical protein